MSPLLQHGPVRPLYRALAWVLGPLLMAAASLMVLLDLTGNTAHGWPLWSERMHVGLWLGLGNLIMGRMLWRAARSGRDPYLVAERRRFPRG
jgi:hypothetical protein